MATSLLIRGEVWNLPGTLYLAWKAMLGRITWLEAERWEVIARQAGRPVAEVTEAGVRVFVVPQDGERKPWHKPRETDVREQGSEPRLPHALPVRDGRKAKPRRGKGDRKVDVRRLERGNA